MNTALMRYLADLAEVQERHFDDLDRQCIRTTVLRVETEDMIYNLYEEGWDETYKPVT